MKAMEHKYDQWRGIISGLLGGFITMNWLNITWESFYENMSQIFWVVFMAIISGAAGMAGKHLYTWAFKEFKKKKKYMSQTTLKLANSSKPAPRWFRKTKKALTILADTAVIILLAMGFKENSLLMLMCRVGLSGLLTALETLLANGEDYTEATAETDTKP